MSFIDRATSSRTVRLVFLEAFLIVFGVGIAWGTAQWQDRQERERRAELALGAILEELAENRAMLGDAVEYHSGVIRELLALGDEDVASRATFQRGFISPASVVTASWQLGNESGAISELPYPRLLELARVYADHESYEAQTRELGALIYERIFNEGSRTILETHRHHLEVVYTLYFRECTLFATITETLTSFDRPPTDSAPDACLNMPGR